GDLDEGANPTASSGFWIASAGVNGSFSNVGTQVIAGTTYRLFKIGTGTWSATNTSTLGTTLNFVARTGDALVHPQKYFKDGTFTSINGSDSRLSVGGAISVGFAAAYTWNNAGGDFEWGNAQNYDLNTVVPGALDSLVLSGAGAGTITVNGNRTIGSINASAAGYT